MPYTVFKLTEAVLRLEPCTIEQVRAELKLQWPAVRSANTFAEHYGLIMKDDYKKIVLTDICKRMFFYSGTKQIDFLINHVRMYEKEPLAYLIKSLVAFQKLTIKHVGEMLQNKFDPGASWGKEEIATVSECYTAWLELLRYAKKDGDTICWIGGKVSVFDVTALAELDYLQDRFLYDFLTESFHTPKNITDEPNNLLEKISNEKDDKKRSIFFEDFIISCFKRFGFSPRTKAGMRDTDSTLSYKDNRGAGDVVILSHFPIHASTKEYVGCALACEAKSTEGQVGSKAVGQARNLKAKIEENYKGYIVYPIVVSRAKYGYDGSGRDIAPPDVVLLNQDTLLELSNLQKERLEKGSKLILPVHILSILEQFIKSGQLEPTADESKKSINNILE